MSPENLRDLLARVHERLNAGSVDPGSREMLRTVMRDIERTLGHGGGPKEGETAHHLPRLEEFAVRFEAEHPALAAVLRQLADALGKAGI